MKDLTREIQEDTAVRLFRALLRAGMAVGGEVRPLFHEHGITPPQWDVLQALAAAGPDGMMLSDLSQRLLVTCGNITGLVDRLEEAGLVERTDDPQDRRVVRARLTPQGREVHGEMRPEYRKRVAALLGNWDPERQEELTTTLERLATEVLEKRAQAGE